MRAPKALLLLAAALLSAAGPAQAEGTRFASIALHDVVDTRDARADDSVTTQSLVSFLDYLVADGWTAVSLDQVVAANEGRAPLPDKAILLTFDDGYASFYERVYPLLLAYRMPAVLALVTSWIDVPPGGMVDYGGRQIPRDRFVTWDQVRRMAQSGLVEVASHSDNLHRVVLMNREGNTAPAARTWAYDPATATRESDAGHLARIRADLERSRARIAAETGKAPRAIVWPFGRFSALALEAAQQAGFTIGLTLEPEAADASDLLAIHRYYPTRDPDLGTMMFNLGFPPPRAQTVRLACLDLAPLGAAQGDAARDAVLGRMVEEVRALGATAVVLPLLARDAPPESFLPTPAAPLAADVFGRAARQLSTRAGVEVFGALDAAGVAALGDARAGELLADAARSAPIDGLLLPAGGPMAPAPAAPLSRADKRAARSAGDTQATRLFAAAAAVDPRLRLIVAGPVTPGPGADRALLPAPAPELEVLGWHTPDQSGRVVETLDTTSPAQARKVARALQRKGATGLAACPFDGQQLMDLAPWFSAATYPWRP